jgi:hypothetical protein
VQTEITSPPLGIPRHIPEQSTTNGNRQEDAGQVGGTERRRPSPTPRS